MASLLAVGGQFILPDIGQTPVEPGRRRALPSRSMQTSRIRSDRSHPSPDVIAAVPPVWRNGQWLRRSKPRATSGQKTHPIVTDSPFQPGFMPNRLTLWSCFIARSSTEPTGRRLSVLMSSRRRASISGCDRHRPADAVPRRRDMACLARCAAAPPAKREAPYRAAVPVVADKGSNANGLLQSQLSPCGAMAAAAAGLASAARAAPLRKRSPPALVFASRSPLHPSGRTRWGGAEGAGGGLCSRPIRPGRGHRRPNGRTTAAAGRGKPTPLRRRTSAR